MSAFIHFDLINIHKREEELQEYSFFFFFVESADSFAKQRQAYSGTTHGQTVCFICHGSHQVKFHIEESFNLAGGILKAFSLYQGGGLIKQEVL